MKTVLCYGDSNTWGYNAATEARHPYEQRWTTLLAGELGADYLVIPEGLNGRTTVMPDPFEGEYKSGKDMLPGILESHHPIDIVVLMLGTNDLKHRWGHSPWDIARGIETLVELIQRSGFGPDDRAPQILVVSPAATCVAGTRFAEMFAGSDEKSTQLARFYRPVAELYGCAFLDAAQHIVSDPIDGIHLAAEELPKLAGAVATAVRGIAL
jgi:lysophospholipase L1-like esterase